MSSVAVVAPRPVPFVRGGAERHWDALVAALTAAGHDARLVALDSPESSAAEVLDGYRRFHDLDLSDFDVVVSGKYPSWMVRHPRHVRHLNHPLRGLYDLYPPHLPGPTIDQIATVGRLIEQGPTALLDWAQGSVATAPDDPAWSLPGPLIRAVVRALDAEASARLSAQSVVSETVLLRPSYQDLFPEDPAVAVVAPLTDLTIAGRGPLDSSAVGAHFLAFGRLTADKRFDLAIAAFARSGLGSASPDPFELWIAGTGPEDTSLRALARRTRGVHLLGFCTDEELSTYLHSAVAVVATPRDEDYGLVAAEAHAAGRPVITLTDSGGIAEQVMATSPPGGEVTPPFPRLVARAMRSLALDPQRADRLGRAGHDRVDRLSWEPLIRLVEHTAARHLEQPRPRVLVLSTFVAEPVTGGGSRRLRSVAAELHRHFDVTIVALTNESTGVRRRLLDDGVVQIAVGRSAAHLRADHEMQSLVGLPVDDIAVSVLHPATEEFGPILASEVDRADVVVLAHPFLSTALAAALDARPAGVGTPVVYDAHNVEIDLKQRLLQGRPGARRLMEWCVRAEATALGRASLVSAVSDADLARLCPTGCGHRNLVAPNGVEDRLLQLPPGPSPQRNAARSRLLADLGLEGDRRPIVLFVGSSHTPNHEAADRLADIGVRSPDLLVVLAGGHSERPRTGAVSLGRFSDHDLVRLLHAAEVIVNPVSVGSGTNLKLIEALGSGTPVVATPTGARGLPDPEQVLLLAQPHQLLDAVRKVITQPGPARERAMAGQDLARRYRWDHALAPLVAAIAGLLGVPLAP